MVETDADQVTFSWKLNEGDNIKAYVENCLLEGIKKGQLKRRVFNDHRGR